MCGPWRRRDWPPSCRAPAGTRPTAAGSDWPGQRGSATRPRYYLVLLLVFLTAALPQCSLAVGRCPVLSCSQQVPLRSVVEHLVSVHRL